MKDEHKISRRQVIAGLGATIATAASPAIAMARGLGKTDAGAALSDPTKLYSKPPFKFQPQPWPGLQSKMDPVPDCGETSYKGSGRLSGRKALITGGDSIGVRKILPGAICA